MDASGSPAALALGVLALIGYALVGATASRAQSSGFYKGKTVTIVAGFSPGGGYDAYDRLLARHMTKHIPGAPNIVVQNMPGAGSLTAARALARTMPQDGTMMLTFNPGLVTQSIVEPEKVGLDFRAFGWIGIFTPDYRVCWGYGPNGVKSWADLMSRRQFVVGTTAKGAGAYINEAMLREILGAPIKHILGFPGSAEQRLAIERGELDGDCGTWSSIPADWLRGGKAHPFVRFTRERPDNMLDSVKYINELAATRDQIDLLDFLDGENEIGRTLIMSGSAPADRVSIMRRAFDDSLRDPELLADAAREGLPIDFRDGAAAARAAAEILKARPEIVERARKIFE